LPPGSSRWESKRRWTVREGATGREGPARPLLRLAAVLLKFNRGTVLLLEPPSGFDVAALPGVLWDARVQAHRAPGCAHAAVRSQLKRQGVSFSDQVPERDPHPAPWPAVELRPYQDAALCAWELAGRRGVVVLPTGSGKTRVALAVMARTRLRTLCLVPTRVLLDQWLREIGRLYPGAVGCLGDGVHTVAPVTVATFESGLRHMDRLGNRFDLLIVDEVHHFGGGQRDEAMEMSIASARLGLTATPVRPDHPSARRLAELVGPTVFELAVADLAGRFLASFDLIALHLDLSETERKAYSERVSIYREAMAQFRRQVPEASWEDFARIAVRTDQGRRALLAFRQARALLGFTEAKRKALGSLLVRHADARLLVFTADNQTAYAISREHLIMPLTCDIGRHEREEALTRFREGALRALVSARVLNEGMDVPDAGVAVVVGGSQGEREHVQRVGRILRPRPGKRAVIYELITRGTMEVRQARRRREALAPRVSPCL
jgi:superfamily II DNA or RNA helicase